MTPNQAPSQERFSLLGSRAMRWAIGVGAATVASIALVLLFLLAQATDNRAMYEQNYVRLFGVNVVVAGLLLAVIGWIGLRLFVRLRRGRFGSRLLMKLAVIFAVLGFLPGMLIYTVSYQFVARSIESWFDVKVEGALDAGLSLGRSTLDALASDLSAKTRAAGAQVANQSDAAAGLALERIRDQLAASDVVLWNASGHLVASAGQSRFDLSPERPTPQVLRNVRNQRSIALIEGLDDPGLPGQGPTAPQARIKALALVTGTGVDLNAEARYLQVTQALPSTLVTNAIAVQEAYREYQERALARGGLRRMYIGTLTLTLFLAVFAAVLLAVLLGNQLARPLLVLAEGVREVAAGDLSPKSVLQGKDELGGLTRSFADMTQQLSDARAAIDKSMNQVDTARANLQTILDNLTTGVIVLDAQGHIVSSNLGATRILRAPLAAMTGQLFQQVPGLEEFGRDVQAQFDSLFNEREQHGIGHWQQSYELHAAPSGPQQDATSVVARGAELPASTRLLVFDDISEIVSAQRARAWGEVARRLAHEIKNPLTPIQLSAERLAFKLDGKVDAASQAVLTKSVRTIVEQVDAMKRLVNEFRDYARLPTAELAPLDLNALVADVLLLYEAEHGAVGVRAEYDPACPPILGDAQQLRQVLHNLVQNAQDATEAVGHAEPPPVLIRTRYSESTKRVRLSVIDSGIGFPENILQRAFEPYVTTKSKGTGLGLAVVRKIADEHGARIDIGNRTGDGGAPGAQVSLSLPLAPQGAEA
ncbi:HAMP domain-containing protein [Xylophilus rhododendri]|uniref:histidine kinase n=1 Tax=Xylophilus rhododendri TaxID=2697032 RepID=A0A857J3W3_9BURK|nr:ATP-binding protein [Xylophilus rhododendri]QHI98624.1 HAMP domain-containing protein [Xylophilus rhododendri]